MDQSKALHQLGEAADLIRMLETLMNSNESENGLGGAALSGMKITLRNVRETICTSQARLAADFVSRSRARAEGALQTQESEAGSGSVTTVNFAQDAARVSSPGISMRSSPIVDSSPVKMQRKDLRASLEKMLEG